MVNRILFTLSLLSPAAFAQVEHATLSRVAEVTPFLIKNGCSEKVTLMMVIPGERAIDCYGVRLTGVRVTAFSGESLDLGTVMIFPAARDLTSAEEVAASIRHVFKRKKPKGTQVAVSALRYYREPLDLSALSGNPADAGSYYLGGIDIESLTESSADNWRLTTSDKCHIGLN